MLYCTAIEFLLMITAIVICAVTVVLMISSILFFPKLRIKKFNISLYWVIALVGVIALLIVKHEHVAAVGQEIGRAHV